jgi:hypothetical protein
MVLIWLRDSRAFLPMLPGDTLNVHPQLRMEQVPDEFVVGHFVRFFL